MCSTSEGVISSLSSSSSQLTLSADALAHVRVGDRLPTIPFEHRTCTLSFAFQCIHRLLGLINRVKLMGSSFPSTMSMLIA